MLTSEMAPLNNEKCLLPQRFLLKIWKMDAKVLLQGLAVCLLKQKQMRVLTEEEVLLLLLFFSLRFVTRLE